MQLHPPVTYGCSADVVLYAMNWIITILLTFQWDQELQGKLSICHSVIQDPFFPKPKITAQWDLKEDKMLNRNLDTHQDMLPHATKCHCPGAGKFITRDYITPKSEKKSLYIKITSYICKCPKVFFSSFATGNTLLSWNAGACWLIIQ